MQEGGRRVRVQEGNVAVEAELWIDAIVGSEDERQP